jgi:hypothetical protein
MLLFGHIGITLGIAWLIESRLKVRMNYGLIIAGSLLPDIIDKPLGMLLLPLNSGRIFAHTLLFILILLLIGIKYRKFLFLSFASFLHLIEDEMWNAPETLFWPLLGDFSAGEYSSFHEYIADEVSKYSPSFSSTFIFEVAGFIIALIFLKERVIPALRHKLTS